MAARVKTWDDAARLLLGSIGTSGAVRWYSGDLKQHKSARIRRSAASPHDLEIVVCQQRSRRESGRGSSKSVLGQASAGWNWLKKQAGKGVQVRNGRKEHIQQGKTDASQAHIEQDHALCLCVKQYGCRMGEAEGVVLENVGV